MCLRALALFALIAIVAVPALAQEHAQRHLVYNFTLGVQNDTHDTDSAQRIVNDPGFRSDSATIRGTGDTRYYGTASDTGAITVDIAGMRPDGGLMIEVGEVGRTYRSAAPVACAIYPTTKIACAGPILPEEAAVVMTLSPAFFNSSQLDSKNHWHEDGGVAGLSLDFTASAPNGSVVTIAEDRSQEFAGGLGGTVHGSATFTYDTVRRVTTALKAYDTERTQAGPGQYTNIIYDITATLATDQTAAKN